MTEPGILGHIWPIGGKLYEIFDNLTKVSYPHMNVYKKEDIPDEYHWKHNRRIPPIFINPAVSLSVEQSRENSNVSWVYGSHWWPPQKSRSYPIFFARGPVFKKIFEIQPFSTLNLYPLMCHLLGIVPQSNNGSMEKVIALLQESISRSTLGSPTAGKAEVAHAGTSGFVGYICLHVNSCLIAFPVIVYSKLSIPF